ncbi:aminotransferase class I/II-fold pyridoxal phosphate-dependent enzyme [Metallosphaera tengchongensis]|uniref:Aminotransferase class I/II-fold pyridoxal phosphate-dependent enzyme n=1 Tax=Metallosphaera tengchongensis TaxID=1532350 RepID=A0A6N0P008_9CREN|nr:aminotransferase class I/II-fold pyridoxal phosphate-dependent enzyme [Metallosphaera tengchongensis]QKR01099.1 aminotransferase class I/II-fold pyridoxal phosphate-dependent enzyme [Metallosphaera tengchongensis]
MKDSTKSVRETIDPTTGAIVTPIYQTSAFLYPEGERYRYSREVNPTVLELARKIAELEEAEAGLAFSSGMGAISTSLLTLLRPGSKLLIHVDMFGRSVRFARDYLTSWGIKVDVAPADNDVMLEMVKQKYDVVFVESITNPTLRVIDIESIGKVCRDLGSTLIVDSTFATPINQKPTMFGASLVVHSASKFIAGHNDVITGLIAGKEEIVRPIDQMRRTLGTSLDPHPAFLTIRGMKTLKIRMDVINSNAMKVAEFLENHKKVRKVYYPGLKSHETHNVAKRVLKGYGGVVSFEVKGNSESALKVMKSTKVITPAQSLGGVNSLISHPATMSHRTLSPEERKASGISDSLLRLSVGIEDVEDLIEDLDRALSSI